eukprot:TRINITY_DN349_c1_g1_i2.p1 TRINITY_DN349_c1_g1~~TRINITY_DN349_c1_g1_i2.p1  ORF type:complete len:733 (-),score=188.15 TRINITY_DN349_c1_g1_i2:78-2276(-)
MSGGGSRKKEGGIGPDWTEDELVTFYNSVRSRGPDFEAVAKDLNNMEKEKEKEQQQAQTAVTMAAAPAAEAGATTPHHGRSPARMSTRSATAARDHSGRTPEMVEALYTLYQKFFSSEDSGSVKNFLMLHEHLMDSLKHINLLTLQSQTSRRKQGSAGDSTPPKSRGTSKTRQSKRSPVKKQVKRTKSEGQSPAMLPQTPSKLCKSRHVISLEESPGEQPLPHWSHLEHFLRLRPSAAQPQVGTSGTRWCICEFFYSDIDRPFFAENLLERRLAIAGVARPSTTGELARVRRRALGRPRRFSARFVDEERARLREHRDSVRHSHATDEMSPGTPVIASYRGVVWRGMVTRAATGSRYEVCLENPNDRSRFEACVDDTQLMVCSGSIEAHIARPGIAAAAASPLPPPPHAQHPAPPPPTAPAQHPPPLPPPPAPTHVRPTPPVPTPHKAAHRDSPLHSVSGGSYEEGAPSWSPPATKRHCAAGSAPPPLDEVASAMRLLDEKQALLGELRFMNNTVKEACAAAGSNPFYLDSVRDSYSHAFTWIFLKLNENNARFALVAATLQQSSTQQQLQLQLIQQQQAQQLQQQAPPPQPLRTMLPLPPLLPPLQPQPVITSAEGSVALILRQCLHELHPEITAANRRSPPALRPGPRRCVESCLLIVVLLKECALRLHHSRQMNDPVHHSHVLAELTAAVQAALDRARPSRPETAHFFHTNIEQPVYAFLKRCAQPPPC